MVAFQIGVDIIEIDRVAGSLERYGDRFRARVYTVGELRESRGRPSSLAARFAAKEAVIKALGQTDVPLREIEVVRPEGGRPTVRLYGKAAAYAERLGVVELSLSLSHCQTYAVAMVVLRRVESTPE